MKARIHCTLFDDTLIFHDVSADDINILNIDDVVFRIKKKHKIPGKLFTVITDDLQVFQVMKVDKVWRKFELKGPKDEEL